MKDSIITSIWKLEEVVNAMKRNMAGDYTGAVEIMVDRDVDGAVVTMVQYHLNDDRASAVFELRNFGGDYDEDRQQDGR